MKKLLFSLTAFSLISVSAPAFAGDDAASNTVFLPFRVLSFGVGAVVGVPVSIVKHTVSNVPKHTEAIADKMGGKDNGVAVFFAAPPAIVSGFVFGAGQGVYSGTLNSVNNCAEKPFSPASMSLADSE